MGTGGRGFTVTAGTRSSGARYWSVRGTINGKQTRRQFSDRADALIYAEQRDAEQRGHPADHRKLLTHLEADQVRAAEEAMGTLAREFPGMTLNGLLGYYRQLSPIFSQSSAPEFVAARKLLQKRFPNTSLAEVCAWFVQHYRPAKSSITLTIALEHYLADTVRRQTTGSLSKWQCTAIGFAMAQLERFFGPKESIGDITTLRLKEYLRETTKAKDGSLNYSNKTWSNKRGYLTTFFKYCKQEGWIEENPATGLRNFTRKDFKRPTPCVLTAAQAKELMEYLETHAGGRMVPFFVLAMFCGIRPTYKHGEIARIKPSQFNLATGELSLRAEDTKTRRPRLVKLQPNVVQWLTAYPLEKNPIIAANFPKLYFKIRKDFKLGFDVLRHTYCSMLVGKFRSVGDAALQAGNSEDVIWGSYLNLVSATNAEAFWQISPRTHLSP